MTFDQRGFLDTAVNGWIKEYRSTYASWFDLADRLNEHSHEMLFKIDAHDRDMEEVLVATLYLRIMDTFQAVVLLAERGMMTQARTLTRCMLDATFPLCAISKDENHFLFRQYIECDLIHRRRFMRKYRKLSNAQEIHLKELDILEAELSSQIQETKIKEMKAVEWAEKAGLLDWYNTIYSTLSDAVHASPRDLAQQHLVINDQGEIKEFARGPSDRGIEELLMTATQGMVAAMLAVAVFFKLPELKAINNQQSKLDELARELA